MKRLITLGCSLTHQFGWAEHVSKETGLPLLNLAVSSGSNPLQISKMQRMILKGEITSEDLIIWQITSVDRPMVSAKANESNLSIFSNQPPGSFIITEETNIFDDLQRIQFLSHSPLTLTLHRQMHNKIDNEQKLEDILFILKITKMFSPNLLVLFGWETVLPEKHINIFKNYLKQFDIDCIDDDIVHWCKSNKLSFNGSNMTHPSDSSYRAFADALILPKIREKFL